MSASPLPMSVVKEFAEQEMALYDSMHPCIRKIMAEHSEGMYLIGIFQNNPEAYRLAMQAPRVFADKLKRTLDAVAADNRIRTREAIDRMIREYRGGSR